MITWLAGCGTDVPGGGPTAAPPASTPGKSDDVTGRRLALPRPGGLPWGGDDPARWSPEAVLANAASEELTRAWTLGDVRDAIVAVPARIEDSALHPFGDGQSNAAVSLGPWWDQPSPPLVATWIDRREGGTELHVRLDGSLASTTASAFDVEVLADGGQAMRLTAAAELDDDGHLRARTPLPRLGIGSTATGTSVWIRPVTWRDGFWVTFAHPVRSVESLVESARPALRDFGAGRSLPDPESIGLASSRHDSVEGALVAHRFGPGYNPQPYATDVVHGLFPDRARPRTATGGARTWLAEPPAVPFKHLYVCFDGRLLGEETAHGVPTGAGWHRIGDAGESIVHSLEQVPLLTGFAGAAAAPSDRGVAYGLGSSPSFRALWPGEALVTPRGALHWYAIPSASSACVEIWVHPCEPGSSLSFACGS